VVSRAMHVNNAAGAIFEMIKPGVKRPNSGF
jgi:hypothetical protein